jgi:uncharacterized protein with beta-barrel porin domain
MARRLGVKRASCALTQARPLGHSIRALSASLLASTSILVTPVTISAPLTAATLVASTWLGATPAAAQFFPLGGNGGDSGGYTPGGLGGDGSGCFCGAAQPGTSDASFGGGGGGGGAPNAAGANGGDGDNAGGTGGPTPGANGGVGSVGAVSGGGGGGGGAGGAIGATSFSNSTINGGAGGAGGVGGAGNFYGGGGGGGGAGGYGVRFSGSGAIVTGSSFSATGGVGGNGGNGGSGAAYGGNGGSGGDGGVGVWLGSAVTDFTNAGTITGGRGGDAGIGGTSAGVAGNDGFAGSGGIGLAIDGTTVVNNSGATIAGGDAGTGIGGFGPPLHGGNGIYAYSRSTIINSGTIIGGNVAAIGGYAGFGIFLPSGGTITNNVGGTIQGGAAPAGIGGAAIYAANATITNRGTITSGAGTYSFPAIFGYNLTIINSGTINAGAGPAIGLSGGNNVLELQAGSVINGVVYGGCGCGTNTLRFGGPVFGGIGGSLPPSETFDLTLIGPVGQYQDFNLFEVTGGSWAFTGAATQTDPWTITNGVVFLSGDLSAASSVTVNSNGLLIGLGGLLGNTQINSGGFFAPGLVPGQRQAINGTLGFASGAQYLITVDPLPANTTGADVTGVTTIAGGTVQAFFQSAAYTAGLYNILTASSVTGTFTGGLVAINSPDGLFPSLNYSTPGEVNIELSATAPTVTGLSKNAQNVVDAITNFANNGGTVPGSIAGLFGLAGDAANQAFGQLAGQPGPAAAQSGINATNSFINTIFDAVFGGSGGGIGGGAIGYASETNVSPAAAEAYAAVTPRDRRAAPFAARWNVWATTYGGYNKVDGSASTGTADTTSRVFGLVAGAEYRFAPDTKAGFVMGGSTSNFDLSNGFGNGSADAFNLAVYGKHQMGPAYVAGALGYSLQSAKTKRIVAGTNVLEADFTANVITARLEGGYRFAMAPINIAPYAALQSTTYFLPSYSEHATAGLPAFALSYDSDAITATRTELGARFDKVIASGDGIWKLKSKLAWAHDWNTNMHATATFQALPGATFTVNGAEPSADSALVSLGAEYAWGNGWSLAANFDGEFSSTTSSYAGKGTLRYQW